jgi:ABC-type transport system substrate-binding protein
VVLERFAPSGAASNLIPASAALDPQPAQAAPIQRVTFRIVPDAIVRALELRKGSADVEVSSLSPDMIPILAKRPELQVSDRAGTNFAYLGVNFEDPLLAKKEVRQALAYAIDRQSLVNYLLHGEARLATGILPPEHWGRMSQMCRPTTTIRRGLNACWTPPDSPVVRMARACI